jgi:hypothetical protein
MNVELLNLDPTFQLQMLGGTPEGLADNSVGVLAVNFERQFTLGAMKNGTFERKDKLLLTNDAKAIQIITDQPEIIPLSLVDRFVKIVLIEERGQQKEFLGTHFLVSDQNIEVSGDVVHKTESRIVLPVPLGSSKLSIQSAQAKDAARLTFAAGFEFIGAIDDVIHLPIIVFTQGTFYLKYDSVGTKLIIQY